MLFFMRSQYPSACHHSKLANKAWYLVLAKNPHNFAHWVNSIGLPFQGDAVTGSFLYMSADTGFITSTG